MQVTAIAKNVRVSPQKARLVADQIKKMTPQKAVKILDFLPQKAAPVIKKVIASAIANAKNNSGMDETLLVFKEIQIGKGLTMRRYRPISRGRAHHILRRTSHIRVVLEASPPENPKSEARHTEGRVYGSKS